nr:protein C09G12.4 [imported] - Caenorhabditis elegans [Caenorhabditis elegans]
MKRARRNPYVTSGHYYSLQKYIYWQTLTTLIFEAFTMIFSILQVFIGSSFSDIFIITAITNTVITPLTIQISYLGTKKWFIYPSANFSLKNFIKTLLFPTVNHFYEMVKFTYYLFVVSIMCIVLTYCTTIEYGILFHIIMLILIYFILCTLYLCTEAFHFLTFLLAAQRCLIFFFPSSEKHVVLFQKRLFKYIWQVYSFCFVKEIVLLLIFCSNRKNHPINFEMYSLVVIALFYALLFLSTAFYIPIIFNARRMFSAQSCAMQKYIYTQTLTVFICKSIALSIFIYLITFGTYPPSSYAVLIVATDIVTTPLIVQISYLGSNRWKLKPKAKFSLSRVLRVLCDVKKPSVIAPKF